jgi:hypothetical protein
MSSGCNILVVEVALKGRNNNSPGDKSEIIDLRRIHQNL